MELVLGCDFGSGRHGMGYVVRAEDGLIRQIDHLPPSIQEPTVTPTPGRPATDDSVGLGSTVCGKDSVSVGSQSGQHAIYSGAYL